MRVLTRALRPGEWVVFGFLTYCVLRISASGGFTTLDPSRVIKFPSADIVFAAFAFVLLKQALPWLRLLPVGRRLVASFLGSVLLLLTLFSLDAPTGDVNLPWLARLRPSLLALDCLVLGAVAFMAARHDPRGACFRLLARLREWIPPVALLCFYPLVPLVMAGAADRDELLIAADRSLFFGLNPLNGLERLISNPLSAWMTLCYSGYILVILVGLGSLYLREDLRAFRELSFAMAFALACGYIGYTLVPAQGPMYTEHFSVELSLGALKEMKEALMDAMRIPRDCFPSLHTGVTMVVAAALRRHAQPLFRMFLPIVLTMPIACMYLRYHYAVDVLAGLALAAFANWLATRQPQLPGGVPVA